MTKDMLDIIKSAVKCVDDKEVVIAPKVSPHAIILCMVIYALLICFYTNSINN